MKAKLVLSDGLRQVSFAPGETLVQFLDHNDIDIEEYTVVFNGEHVDAEKAAATPMSDGDVVAPVPEVTNG